MNRLGLSALSLLLTLMLAWTTACDRPATSPATIQPETLRVMTYNIEDVRTSDLRNREHPRLTRAAARIQALRPDILVVQELTVDQPGAPGYQPGDEVRMNGQRFAENFLAVAQADSLEPLQYRVYMPLTNTGEASGYDLDNNGSVVTEVPQVPAPEDGRPAPQNDAGRAYGGDAWGFGTFPGQYGMALFVRDGLTIVRDSIRTLRLFTWSDMPDAAKPVDSETGEPWYSDEEWANMRLSSKTHMDVPVTTPTGDTIHVLASHPTPPGFDGPADRNGRRNHDEIRLWADYVSNASYVYDDSLRAGGLPPDARFVIVGDQNADPDEGDGYDRAIHQLLDHPRVQGSEEPTASDAGQAAFPDLDPDDTARWGLRADYVLPSENLRVVGSGVYRPSGADTTAIEVSDHFPVWVDVVPIATETPPE